MNHAVSKEPPQPTVVHGSAVALDGRAILLIGPPGCGKSDLALRLIDSGAQLIADDAVRILAAETPQPGRCWAAPMPGAAGKLMVRDIGVIRLSKAAIADTACPLALVVDLHEESSTGDGFARLGEWCVLPDRPVPRIMLPAFQLSSIRKLHLALRRWGH
jgi:serine kinase of HPr protein (carbohydrate metabolism regulator)